MPPDLRKCIGRARESCIALLISREPFTMNAGGLHSCSSSTCWAGPVLTTPTRQRFTTLGGSMPAQLTVLDVLGLPKAIRSGVMPARVIAVIVIVGSIPWWEELAITLTLRR